MKRLVQVVAMACAAMLAATASHSQGQESYAPLGRPLMIQQVPDTNIFYSIGSPGIPGKENEGNTSNAGFVITDDGVVVFDALGTPSLGWALLRNIQKRTDKKVRFVIASHSVRSYLRIAGVQGDTGARSSPRSARPSTRKMAKRRTSGPISALIKEGEYCFRGSTRIRGSFLQI